jgi:hypothetical protein
MFVTAGVWKPSHFQTKLELYRCASIGLVLVHEPTCCAAPISVCALSTPPHSSVNATLASAVAGISPGWDKPLLTHRGQRNQRRGCRGGCHIWRWPTWSLDNSTTLGAASRKRCAEPDGLAGDLADVPGDRLRRFGLLGYARSYRPRTMPAEEPRPLWSDARQGAGTTWGEMRRDAPRTSPTPAAATAFRRRQARATIEIGIKVAHAVTSISLDSWKRPFRGVPPQT